MKFFDWFFSPPDIDEFQKTFPDVNVKNLKFKGGDVYVDTTTGVTYLHGVSFDGPRGKVKKRALWTKEEKVEYQRHPELNDVLVPKGVTTVRALDGVNVFFILGGQWHKSEKHTSSSLTLKEYHEEYCIKKDNQWVYNA